LYDILFFVKPTVHVLLGEASKYGSDINNDTTYSLAVIKSITHDELQVDALLESHMQGLHVESIIWTGMVCCVGQHPIMIHTIVCKSLVKVL
jgi:hypothetical protein